MPGLEINYCKCLSCRGIFKFETISHNENRSLERGYCASCGGRKLEWEWSNNENKEEKIRWTTDECPSCYKLVIVEILNWDELARSYGNEPDFPKSKEQLISEIKKVFYDGDEVACNCSVVNNPQEEENSKPQTNTSAVPQPDSSSQKPKPQQPNKPTKRPKNDPPKPNTPKPQQPQPKEKEQGEDKTQQSENKQGFNWTPWLISLAVVLMVGLIFGLFLKKILIRYRKKRTKKKFSSKTSQNPPLR